MLVAARRAAAAAVRVLRDEVWTGIEYQVAAHLIYEGLVDEGVDIVRAVRNRYDGQRRNPWNEVECGHHYARAMASWSLLLAFSGFHYSAPQQRMGFRPANANDERFSSFWSADPGWGTYVQERSGGQTHATITLLYGSELRLSTIAVPAPRDGNGSGQVEVRVVVGDRVLGAAAGVENGQALVELEESVTLVAGDALEVRVG